MRYSHTTQLMTSLILTMVIAGMAACGKKNEDSQGISNGTVKSDGAVVSSSSTLAGYGMNVVVSGFKPNSTSTGLINQGFNNTGFNNNGFNNNGFNNGGYSTISNSPQIVTFELRINSDVRNISVSVNNNQIDTINNNNSFNNSYYSNNNYQNSNYINSAQTTIGGALVQTTGACYQSNYSCDEVALSVVLNLGSEYKQIGIRYSLRSNRIVNVRDYQGGQNIIRDAFQLTREM